eukprot:gene8558-17649_t
MYNFLCLATVIVLLSPCCFSFLFSTELLYKTISYSNPLRQVLGASKSSKGFNNAEIPLTSLNLSKQKNNAKCSCGSGLLYKDCCQSLHDFASKSHTSDQVARARFAAYSLGIPQYLIASTHPSQKDYVRHTESNKDLKKAMKLWQKEIITKNTDIYEFLLFDLLSNGTSTSTTTQPSIVQTETSSSSTTNTGTESVMTMETETSYTETVVFRVLLRRKSDDMLYSFQESSRYLYHPHPHPTPSSSSITEDTGRTKAKATSGGFGTPSSSSSSSIASTSPLSLPPLWQYLGGDVSPVSTEKSHCHNGEKIQQAGGR